MAGRRFAGCRAVSSSSETAWRGSSISRKPSISRSGAVGLRLALCERLLSPGAVVAVLRIHDAKPLGLSTPSAGAVSCDRKMKDRRIWLKNFIKPRSVCHPPIEWRGRPVIGKAKLLFCPLQHDHHSKSNFPSDRFRYLLFQSQHRTNQCSWHERPTLKSPAHRIRK